MTLPQGQMVVKWFEIGRGQTRKNADKQSAGEVWIGGHVILCAFSASVECRVVCSHWVI